MFHDLYHSIEHENTPLSRNNDAIRAKTRLIATVQFLIQENMFSTNLDACHMSKASMSLHVNRCMNAKVKICAITAHKNVVCLVM